MNRSKARLVLVNKIGLDFKNLRENKRRRGRNDTKPYQGELGDLPSVVEQPNPQDLTLSIKYQQAGPAKRLQTLRKVVEGSYASIETFHPMK